MSENTVEQEWRPSINPWLAVFPVMLAIFMFVLDETISNVALTYIAGSMSVSHNESTWVLTSYLIASGIAIPLAGMMSRILGRKKYFVICTTVFTFSSLMCALSHSMFEIVLWRFIQGLGGGGLLPIGQSIMLESFPKKERAKSMALFGVVIVFAPLLGPILGGWITENWSWPWIYLINLPIGIACVYFINKLLEDPPYAKAQKGLKMDNLGLSLLALFLISLQIVLDKGNDADWFSTAWICWMSAFSLLCAILFFVSQFLNKKNPLLDLTVLKNRTYFFGTIIQIMLMSVFLASAALLPSMLQRLLGYSAFLSGLSMGTRGIGCMCGVVAYLILSKSQGDRRIAMIGLALLGFASAFFGNINLQINLNIIAIPNILYGMGIFLAMTPLVPLSFSALRNEEMANASCLQNLVKNIGGAIGTSIGTTMVTRYSQAHQHMMVDHLNPANPVYVEKLQALTSAFMQATTDFATAQGMAMGRLYQEMLQQATLWGYIDTFRWFAFATFLLIPLLLFLKKPKEN